MKRIIVAVLLTAVLAVSVMVTSGATTASAVTPNPPVEHPYVEIQQDGQQTTSDWHRVWHWYDPGSITIYLNRSETWAAAYAGGLGSIVNAALGGTPFFGWLLQGYAWLAKVYYGWGYCLGIKLTIGGPIGYFPSLNHCYV